MVEKSLARGDLSRGSLLQRDRRDIIVRFHDVVKTYGSTRVLDNVTFEVPRGQRLVIIGPSGSGKTTILRCLMTLEVVDSGQIEVDGTTVDYTGCMNRRVIARSVRDIRGKVGMVFQQFNLFPHMSTRANVMIAPMRVLGIRRDEAERQATELLGMVGLAEKMDAYPHQLSGGQQQRVAIARALAMRPMVMLFDEVTSALDPELVGEVLKVIRDLAARSGMTMLLVTHEMEFAAEIADRVLFIEGGRIIEDSPPGDIFGNPTKDRTRQFLRALRDR